MPRLEEPCGIPSAPALAQLSRFAAEQVKVVLAGQGADEPHGGYGRHQAAALLAPLRLAPAALASPAAAVARALPRAARARRAAHLLGGRGDAERLLRLVEITDAPVRAALLGRRDGTEARAERHQRGGRRARRRARPRPARAGALPRHPHVPARRHPALQRQDVDGGRPRAARALPRRGADALRRAHPGSRARAPARGQAPAPHGDGAAAAARHLEAPQARLLDPLRRLAASVAGQRGRAPLRAGRPASRPGRAEGGARARGRAPQRARRPQVGALLPARAVAVAPRLRRGGRARRSASARLGRARSLGSEA